MDENDIEELWQAVPEKLSNEDLLEPERECIAEEARGKKTAGEDGPKTIPSEGFTGSVTFIEVADLNKFLKKL